MTCPTCKGDGQVQASPYHSTPEEIMAGYQECEECEGVGSW